MFRLRVRESKGTAYQRLPTGKHVEMAVAVIVGFKDRKISHEYIYRDQAGVLVQIGMLDPTGLPVSGAESARRVLDPKLPAHQM